MFGHNGFLLGGEAAYNVSTGAITGYSAGVGFSAPEYAVSVLASNHASKYTASYYHRVSRDVEAGARAVYEAKHGANTVHLEVGSKT